MGVLLHLYSMDKSKLELLGYEQEDEIFEWGMEFLVAASTTSTLASRYTGMLQSVRPKLADNGPEEQRGSWLPVSSTTVDSLITQSANTSGAEPWQSRGMHNANGEIDLDGMNFDDLLLGTGLPQEIIPFSYPHSAYDV